MHTIKTRDLDAAAYVLSRGGNLVKSEFVGGTTFWHFLDDDTVDRLLDEFDSASGAAKIAIDFIAARKRLYGQTKRHGQNIGNIDEHGTQRP